MNRQIISLVVGVILVAPRVESYELETHRALTKRAFQRSALESTSVLADLGSTAQPSSSAALSELGAVMEDANIRPISHFYDPYHDSGLRIPGAYASPDWALEDQGAISGGVQEFSYQQALNYLKWALTAPDKNTRDVNWGRLFESLGHVVHHVQDMAQPQHVRNDAHYHRDWPIVGDPSLYEDCTERAVINLSDWRACGNPLNAPAYPAVRLAKARDYWTTLRSGESYGRGKGIADFTNANFVSKDTNFQIYAGQTVYTTDDGYPLPRPTTSRTFNAEDLKDPRLAEVCERLKSSPRGQTASNAKCEVEFVASDVYDAYTATSSVNEHASSISIFDQYLELRSNLFAYRTDRLFTLNRYNFAAAHPYLISRAIGYSAGLIDHFFRGRMEVKEAEVDGDKVRLEIKNVSAEGNGFGPGTFKLYYDAHDRTRKEAPLETGADLSGRLVVDGIFELTFTVPADLDVAAKQPFVMVFEGIIGEEEAVSGLVLDVPGLFSGISLVVPSTSERRLISFRDGQWVLRPQKGFLVGNIDWKGQYQDGMPTRVLSWTGPGRYKDEDWWPSFNTPIYEGGREIARAPGAVLGAAIQKDAEGNDWLVAVCKNYEQDIIYRRPAGPLLASGTPANGGWIRIAVIDNPTHLGVSRRAWLFNADGTEAQTMRELKRDYPSSKKPLTRLKLTVRGLSTSMSDLGNTAVTLTLGSAQEGTCTLGSATASYEGVESVEGTAIVAVDYDVDQEVVAKLTASGQHVQRSSTIYTSCPTYQRSTEGDVRWTLSFGNVSQDLYHEKRLGSEQWDGRSCAATETDIYNLDWATVSQMDLRSGLLVTRALHQTLERSAQGTRRAGGGYEGDQTTTTSNHTDFFFGSEHLGRFAVAQNTSTASNTFQNWFGECDPADHQWSTSAEIAASIEAAPQIGTLYVGAAAASTAATDPYGNMAFSMLVNDSVKAETSYFNRLTHGDLGQVLGLTWPYYVGEARAQ